MAIPRLVLLTTVLALASASLDSMLADSLDECLGSGAGTEACLRGRVLDYLGAPRAGGDSALAERVLQILKSHDLRLQLPEALQGATLVFKPGRGLDFDIEFPHENDVTPRGARDMMKQKMLFPLLMLIKLKLKALTPIMLAFVGLKATKALVLSKIAILLVVGFLIVQLCQKLGMAKMSMTPAAMPTMDPTPPPSVYGPPTTQSSYDPNSWEPAPGPYARIYDTSQQMAYSGYTTQPANKYKRI
ncbi:unnamed protein product [Nezara viridula]|uniref:Osiris 20 n=1 Tax=Nezara viridula TaxID=85310 RepID=A0A9P0MTC2_NEZVI|nr:unnamed protein product [Nezara viridula]